MKPATVSVSVHNQDLLRTFVEYKKSTKGLTPRGEEWLSDMLGRFTRRLTIPAESVVPEHIAGFLAPYGDRPFQRHALFRAVKSLYRRLKKLRYISDNPMDYIDTPKVPDRVLNSVTPEQAQVLIDSASCTRDKAIISLFADSGARRCELCNARLEDVDLEHNRIRVLAGC